MKIVQINTHDAVGGAAQIARYLQEFFQESGHRSQMMVGCKLSDDPVISLIDNDKYRNGWTKFWLATRQRHFFQEYIFPGKSVGGLARLGELSRWKKIGQGLEDFEFPGFRAEISNNVSADIFHLHNLHSGYFDLRELTEISQISPTVITLHDEWTFTGHCAVTFECQRWKTGCGHCPDLMQYPAIKKDASAQNLARKSQIYKQSRLYVVTPSAWMLNRARQSILKNAAIGWRVIPNGVDLSVFAPEDQMKARMKLGLPADCFICLFVGEGTRSNQYKDYDTMRTAIEISAGSDPDRRILFLAVGEEAADEQIGRHRIMHVGRIQDRYKMAAYYQAADVYLHAAHSDNFPTTILEAMACGTPVIATAIGGIPEQIDDGVNGFLVPGGDGRAMASKILFLATDEVFRAQAGAMAAQKARREFDHHLMAQRYLELYQELTASAGPELQAG